MKRTVIALCLASSLLASACTQASIHEDPALRSFITDMVARHGFNEAELTNLLAGARISDSILEAISRPAEAMPWFKYRDIFLRKDRIDLGREFIEEHRETLARAEQVYGVPPEIIAAIIGVETRFGRNKGGYKVLDSLVTLGFRYPRRAEFFRSELEQFLLLTREQGLDPASVSGSYAGAMGIPQFISSSYRHYAVDFDGDGHIDIWDNPVDAIGSVANYFHVHGWRSGEQVAARVNASGEKYRDAIASGLEPEYSLAELQAVGVQVDASNLSLDTKARLFRYELSDGEELWLGYDNFYVITRYNRSPLYAMAVYQLAGEIAGTAY